MITIQNLQLLKKLKRLLWKYYPRFTKICKYSANLNQFIVLLCDCMPKLKHFLSIEKLTKDIIVSQLGQGKNLTTTLYSEVTKPETKTIKKATITKQAHALNELAIIN